MAEPNQELINNWVDLLQRTREERLDLLPQSGTFVEVVADAMNALEVAYLTILSAHRTSSPQEAEATFVPVSNPRDAKQV